LLAEPPLRQAFGRLGGRTLIAWDGTEYFCFDSAGNKDEGAGDQGIMFGYACREPPELMPAPIFYAHRILKVMSEARRSGESQALGPDAKSQVTIRYENGKPVEATQFVVSTQHYDEKLSSHDIKAIIEPYVRQALPKDWITKQTVWHVNPIPCKALTQNAEDPLGIEEVLERQHGIATKRCPFGLPLRGVKVGRND
jgi:S-adenosylmethionine synthetase, central domain